jgi:hypothetical protein
MKTISMPTGQLRPAEMNWFKSQSGGGSVAEWLPTPPIPRALPSRKPRPKTGTKRMGSIWLPFERETFIERLMLLALVLGAAVAIGYGFSCCLDLAQNWASFNAGVDQMIR